MQEREWIDVEDWNLRHLSRGASVVGSSWGSVETDERGVVVRVSGRWSTGQALAYPEDPDTGARSGVGVLVDTAVQDEHPTRETLLAHGYEDRAVFPLTESDLEQDIQPVSAPPPAPEVERTVAETTHVEAQDRSVTVEAGEMGAPVDVAVSASAPEPSTPEAEGYSSPFTEGPPAGTSAADPAYNPPEGAPAGEDVEGLVEAGQAEVLGGPKSHGVLRRLLGGGNV